MHLGLKTFRVPSTGSQLALPALGARLRGRTATQRSKKGSEKASQKGSGEGVLRRVLRRGPFSMGFTVKKGVLGGFSEGVLRRQLPEGA